MDEPEPVPPPEPTPAPEPAVPAVAVIDGWRDMGDGREYFIGSLGGEMYMWGNAALIHIRADGSIGSEIREGNRWIASEL